MKALTYPVRRLIVLGFFLLYIVAVITACNTGSDSSDSGINPNVGMPGSGTNLAANDQPLPYQFPDWMARVSDSKYLSEIMIPGTHDTGADRHTSQQGIGADPLVVTQDFFISNQLELGVRWFDIRLRWDGANLSVHHYWYFLHKTFQDLLRPALLFLEQNQSEIVVFMIKQEYSTLSDDEFGRHIYSMLLFYGIERFYLQNEVPTIGQARGKMVIVRQFGNTLGVDFGMHFAWADNAHGESFVNDGIDIHVQDHYALVNSSSPNQVSDDEKCNEIIVCLLRPFISEQSKRNLRKFYLNFTSAEREVVNLRTIAANIDPKVEDWLKKNPAYNRGVIMLNFAGGTDKNDITDIKEERGIAPNLVKTIINHNNFIN